MAVQNIINPISNETFLWLAVSTGELTMSLLKEIEAHRVFFKLPIDLDLEDVSIDEYKRLIRSGAYLNHGRERHIMHELSGEILATNKEQVDALIEYLQELKEEMFS